MKKTLIFVGVLLIAVVALFVTGAINSPSDLSWKTINRDRYTFQAPAKWVDNGPRDFEGCRWDGISNDTSDGLRLAGEIGIYEKSCFDVSKALGQKEVAEKDGYYIIAFYDKESGTTQEEEAETQMAYKRLVNSFTVKQ